MSEVLMVGDGDDQRSAPLQVDGAKVSAEVLEQGKADKVLIFKKKRRHRTIGRTRGHRQHQTVLRISDINVA